MKKNNIFFDLDGTLTDSMPGITRAVQYALKHYGITVEDLDILKPFVGPPLPDSFKEYYHFDFQKFLLYDSRVKTFGNEPTDKVFARELKKENRNLAIEYNLSIRQILQYFGTDIMRKYFGDKL